MHESVLKIDRLQHLTWLITAFVINSIFDSQIIFNFDMVCTSSLRLIMKTRPDHRSLVGIIGHRKNLVEMILELKRATDREQKSDKIIPTVCNSI